MTSSGGQRLLVLTAVGADRPGLVREMSRAIHAAGANLEDSRMAILGGEFALIVLAAGPAAALETLDRQAPELGERLGLHIVTKATTRGGDRRDFLPYHLRVTGVDRPGIVQSVTGILADHGVNVASLESRVTYAPLSGTPMFVLEADLQVPSELALSKLRRELGASCDAENLDYTLDAG
jgi:glycine cleavage system transcriptional repressor